MNGSSFARAALLLCLPLVLLPAWTFIAAAPHFGGYDSYYFFLYANDLARSPSETSFARYSYFPGSYAFWRAVAMAAGRDFASYQRVFAAVGLANAALTGLIVRAAGGGALLAAGGFCGYLLFGQRLELGSMTSEPLATLASLLGVLVWVTFLRRGKTRLGLACLGAGYGLAVFTKQQGAFVAMGAIGLAPLLWDRSFSWRVALGDATTVVTTAVAVFVVAMGLDGGGAAAVKLGVATATNYESHGNLVANVVEIALKTPLLFAASAGAVCLWALAFVVSRRRPADHRAVLLHVWGLAATTVVVTLLQYTKRPYAHYALLTLPFALVTITLAGLWSFEGVLAFLGRVDEAGNSSRLANRLGVLAFVVVVSLVGIEAWALPRAPAAEVPPHERYASACEGIEPGQRLLLLPSRENALHWACGTHARGTRWGYTFNFQERPEEYIEELAKPQLAQVFVFKTDRAHSYEQEVAERHNWSGFFLALAQQGFRPVVEGDAGTLYRRVSPSPAVPGFAAGELEEAGDGNE